MKLTELTVRKTLGKKVTLKNAAGSFKSEDVEVESIMTFKDENGEMDLLEAEKQVHLSAKRLLEKRKE